MNNRKFTLVLLALYLVASVYGIVVALFRLPQAFPITPVSTLLAFSFALWHAGQREGRLGAALLGIIVFLTGLLFESVGVATGWIYGPYHYTEQLGPKFLNLVPFLIPIAWTMMMYPSLVIAEQLVPFRSKGILRTLGVAAVGGVVMTAWDVAMDPMMVYLGNWVWEVSGPYFGVPLQNFSGWWLTTFAALLIFQVARRWVPRGPASDAPEQWAVWAYVITGSSTVVVDLVIGLGGAALAGFFSMLPWVVMAFFSYLRESQRVVISRR